MKNNELDELSTKYNVLEKEYNKLQLLYEFKMIENGYMEKNSRELQTLKSTILYYPFKLLAFLISKLKRLVMKCLRLARRIISKIIRVIRRTR